MKYGNLFRTNAYFYVREVNNRINIFNSISKEKYFFNDYDSLINKPELSMRKICDFIGIEFEDILLKPTKMGVPWSGNSIRGIVKEKIFKNPHIAYKSLTQKRLSIIELGLEGFYSRFKYKKVVQLSYINRLITNVKIKLYGYDYKIIWFFDYLFYQAPRFIYNKIKLIIFSK